ncbi:MAG: D-alanine--D-alanine ligase [Bacteroidales bacterium]|nr:D-alanine--D-alanine ligase [Candidatus Latescibacterota bacterium]
MGKRKIKITVLLGGDSPEREVSISSGLGVMEALRGLGYKVAAIDPALPMDRQGEPDRVSIGEAPPGEVPHLDRHRRFEWLGSDAILSADVVFIALHGGAGEDGTIQAQLESAGVRYTGTGIMGSALAMNKDRSKALFNQAGVQTAPHMLTVTGGDIETRRVRETIESGIGFPAIIKPNCQGSSVGFSYLPAPEKLGQALAKAARYGNELLVERFVPGREMTVAILDGIALPVVEIIPFSGFYDYRSKYTKGTSRYEVPAKIDRKWADRLRREAVLAYHALGCRDYARADFRMTDDGEPYCLEVNTLPGMTGLSLVPMAAGEAGISFGQLVEKICLLALDRD